MQYLLSMRSDTGVGEGRDVKELIALCLSFRVISDFCWIGKSCSSIWSDRKQAWKPVFVLLLCGAVLAGLQYWTQETENGMGFHEVTRLSIFIYVTVLLAVCFVYRPIYIAACDVRQLFWWEGAQYCCDLRGLSGCGCSGSSAHSTKAILTPSTTIQVGGCGLGKWSISMASVWAVECMAGVLSHTPPDRIWLNVCANALVLGTAGCTLVCVTS